MIKLTLSRKVSDQAPKANRFEGSSSFLLIARNGLAARSPIGYSPNMSFVLRNLARYAVQKLASNPQVKEAATKAARVAVDEVKEIAGKEDKARAAGRAVRRGLNKLQGDR